MIIYIAVLNFSNNKKIFNDFQIRTKKYKKSSKYYWKHKKKSSGNEEKLLNSMIKNLWQSYFYTKQFLQK